MHLSFGNAISSTNYGLLYLQLLWQAFPVYTQKNIIPRVMMGIHSNSSANRCGCFAQYLNWPVRPVPPI